MVWLLSQHEGRQMNHTARRAALAVVLLTVAALVFLFPPHTQERQCNGIVQQLFTDCAR